MQNMSMMKLFASTMVLGTTIVGCSPNGQASRPANVSEAKTLKLAAAAYAGATKALANKQNAKAVELAEIAVAGQPRLADYRMVLGQAYLAAGRFRSAETSFSDTLTIEPDRERAALNLALTQIALAKRDAARSTLAEYRDRLPAVDFGLAKALVGDVDEAVQILETASRGPNADAKTRQNLALAYAMAGKWAEAKVLATQDLGPDEADVRIAQWASFAKPSGSWDQVASLLGITPAQDAGQPMRLVLAPAAPSPVEVAQADLVPPTPPTEAVEPVAVAVAEDTVRPAYETAVVQPVAVPAVIRAPALEKVAANRRETMRPTRSGRFVVQIGAFSNAAVAEKAWNRVSGRFNLAAFDPVSGSARKRNASLVRVAIPGFATHADASRMCGRIKASGGVCFVRTNVGDTIARWVQRPNTRVAAR